MTFKQLQTIIGRDTLDDFIGGFGYEAGLDESGFSLNDELHPCLALQHISDKLVVLIPNATYESYARLQNVLTGVLYKEKI
jgi:hypothetical protein